MLFTVRRLDGLINLLAFFVLLTTTMCGSPFASSAHVHVRISGPRGRIQFGSSDEDETSVYLQRSNANELAVANSSLAIDRELKVDTLSSRTPSGNISATSPLIAQQGLLVPDSENVGSMLDIGSSVSSLAGSVNVKDPHHQPSQWSVSPGPGYPLRQKLNAATPVFERFGTSVAMSGTTLVVGAAEYNAPGNDNAGRVFVYVRDPSSSTWNEQAILTASDGSANSLFGNWVSIDGDYALVGAHQRASGGTILAGAAYVFFRDNALWSQQAILTEPTVVAFGRIGHRVSIQGSLAVASTVLDNGKVVVFHRTGTTWAHETTLVASDAGIADQFGQSVAVHGDYVLVGANNHDVDGPPIKYEVGRAYVFYRAAGPTWAEQTMLAAPIADQVQNAQFGYAVALHDTYALVSAPFLASGSVTGVGKAYVFLRDGVSTWSLQAELTVPHTPQTSMSFGWSAALFDTVAVLGSIQYDNGELVDSGAVYVFKRTGTSWAHVRMVEHDSPSLAQGTNFGGVVATDGVDVITTARHIKVDGISGAGQAFVFGGTSASVVSRSSPLFLLSPDDSVSETVIAPNAALSNSTFGHSCAMHGSFLLIGAPRVERAHVFIFAESTWKEHFILQPSDSASDGSFGHSVAIYGRIAAVGAPLASSAAPSSLAHSGCVSLFSRSGSTWTQLAVLRAPTETVNLRFGVALSLHDTTLAVSAQNRPSNSGQVHMFHKYSANTTWYQHSLLTASDQQAAALFGQSVSVHGSYALVGAPGHSSAAGQAYMFMYSDTTWTQHSILVSNSAQAGAQFGHSVSVYGFFALIGAPYHEEGQAYVFKSSGATWQHMSTLVPTDGASGLFGVALSLFDDYAIVSETLYSSSSSLTNSGRAYVFVRVGQLWTQQAAIDASDQQADSQFGSSVVSDGVDVVVCAPGASNATWAGPAPHGQAYVYRLAGRNSTSSMILDKLARVDVGGLHGNGIDDGQSTVPEGAAYNEVIGITSPFQADITHILSGSDAIPTDAQDVTQFTRTFTALANRLYTIRYSITMQSVAGNRYAGITLLANGQVLASSLGVHGDRYPAEDNYGAAHVGWSGTLTPGTTTLQLYAWRDNASGSPVKIVCNSAFSLCSINIVQHAGVYSSTPLTVT